jgi:hypothetical protein
VSLLRIVPPRTGVALGLALAYGAGFWLVVLHRAEGGHETGEPGLLIHGLRDGTLALPGVLAAVVLGAAVSAHLGARDVRLRPALVAAGAAAAAAVVLAAGSPLHALFFSAEEGGDLPAAVHLGRDALVALAVGLPLAALVVVVDARLASWWAARATAAPATREPAPAPGVTRRGFVAGAGGLAVAGVTGATLTRTAVAQNGSAPVDRLVLYVNEGHVAMVDGTLVYMRGYGEAALGDPTPSLTISPRIFQRGVVGPVKSRFYPVDAAIPPEGCPEDAGIDPSGLALHFIQRRHWASLFPRRTIVAESGSQIRLSVTNRLREPHTFTIPGVVDQRIEPGQTALFEFAAPAPGTYIYQDTENAPVNRVLGLFGVLVVVPADARWTLDGREGEFERQWLWVFHDIDPEWARLSRMGVRVNPQTTPALPRYFTLNDRSGVFSVAASPDVAENQRTREDTKPCGHGRRIDVRRFSDPSVGTGQMIRIVNTGLAVHQPHFHGNHVWTMAIDNQTQTRSAPTIVGGHLHLQHWEDVVGIDPLQVKAVMLPIKPPPDALDVVLANQKCDFEYPMHCHAEMSQTAGGGLYPGGQLTDWTFRP